MPTVLLVDDASYIRKQIINDLQGSEFSVIGEAANGTEAVSMYGKLKPDVVIMDVVMPNKGGVEAAAEIMIKNNRAKILMVSSIENEVIIMKSLEAGARHFIQKPFDREKLLKALKNVVE